MEPDFSNLLKVLRRETPSRPTLFEFYLNDQLYDRLVRNDAVDREFKVIPAFRNAGYDYATFHVPGFNFPSGESAQEQTRSINEGGGIQDRSSFESYPWPDPDEADYAAIERAQEHLPRGMKLIVPGPKGVLENTIDLVGYQNLCMLMLDDEQLVYDIFEAIGRRLARFYELAVQHESVGACISNDDWGFKTQTMLSPHDMRRFVFPWHKEIVQNVHKADKPVILHSCGYFEEIIDDIAEDIGYDARHSYEDAIMPVEEAYEHFHDRIAILGGIDLDFLCRSTPREVYNRSRDMLDRTAERGGYALGSGNSVPDYVPQENYFAMIRAVTELRS